MSILIKNMEMPKRGETITVTICDDGLVFEEYYKGVFNAVPIPPHRKLIDADALAEFIETLYDATWDEGYAGACVDILERITTSISIPAEESENKE